MTESKTRYIETVGRRKSAVARVRLYHGGSGKILINDRELNTYLPLSILQEVVSSTFIKTGTEQMFDITVHVTGGGIHGQADAIKL